jgi:inner membrane protein
MEFPAVSQSLTRRLLVVAKVATIGLLIVLLHLPLFMTHGVLRERQNYRAQAADDIMGSWGRRQVVTGPVLAVPYVYNVNVTRSKSIGGRVVPVDETEEASATAYFLPEALAVNGTVEPETRHRGIYDVVVYSTALKLSGHFQPDLAAAGITATRVDWNKSEVLVGVSDLRGVRTVGPIGLNGGAGGGFESAEAARHGGLPLAAKAPGATAGARLEFTVDLALQGSERLDFVPVGKITTVELRSAWAAPSFGGAYLPARRTVGSDGFTAAWEVSHFSRGFSQSWSNRGTDAHEKVRQMTEASFGVGFAHAVDGYRLVERAQKYGVLFFVLIFTAFFLFEFTAGLRIHPLQYTLVGAALCLFFLGFLALSEFWSVAAAYATAAAACTAMISLYAWSFLRTGPRTLAIGGSLGLTYGGLYFVLKSQDYALVAGTAALFLGLGLVMYFSRRVNWGDEDQPEAAAGWQG